MNHPEDLRFVPPGMFGIEFVAGTSCGEAVCGVGIGVKNRPTDGYCGGAMTVEQARELRNWLTEYLRWFESEEGQVVRAEISERLYG